MEREKFIKQYGPMRNPYTEEELKELCERWYYVNLKGGVHQNEILVIQECSELIKEVTNLMRPDRVSDETIYDILQEMADVYNVLEYLKSLLGITDYDILRARSVQIKKERLETLEDKWRND